MLVLLNPVAGVHEYEVAPPDESVADAPAQSEVELEVALTVIGVLIVRFVPLSAPVSTGALLTTLTLYPVPVPVPPGMVAVMFPLAVAVVSVPRVTGEAKEPEASES